MEVEEQKKWILVQCKKMYRQESKGRPAQGHTAASLVKKAVTTRESKCKGYGIGRKTMKAKFKKGKKIPTKIRIADLSMDQRESLPPGEDLVRRRLKEMESAGVIKYYQKPLKNTSGNPNAIGGAKRKRIIVPISSEIKLKSYGNPAVLVFFLRLEKIRELEKKNVGDITKKDLCSYVTGKNFVSRFPVECAKLPEISEDFVADVFRFVRDKCTEEFDAFEERLGKRKCLSKALESLVKLVDLADYIVEPLTLIKRGDKRRKMYINPHVNVILNLK